MKVLATLSCVLALGAAQYVGYPYSAYAPYNTPYNYYAPATYSAVPYAPATYSAVPYAAVPAASVSSQYHAQDELGQFNYGYADGLSTKSEVRGLNGVTAGQYSYLDANGEVQTVSYTADDVNGFRVKATNLPVAPVADLKAPVFDLEAPVFDGVAPEPVQDTPEVAAAKAEFAQLYADAAAAAEAAPDTDAEAETAEPAEEQESARRRRSAVLLPALAKATFKTASLDAVEADTPADTTLLKLQEKEHEAYVPTYAAAPVLPYAAPAITYSAPVVQKVEVKHVAAPITYAAAPAIHYTAPAITYSAPIVKKVEVKQVEAPITYAAAPFTYGYGLHPYGLGSPFVYSVAAAEEEKKPTEEETAVVSAERRKRSAVLVPALAKATFKTASLDKVEADTPADTTLLKLKEKEHEAYVHTYAAAPVFRYAAPAITYSTPVVKQVEVKHVAAPITYSAVPFPYAYSGLGSPLVYTVAAKTAEVEEKAE